MYNRYIRNDRGKYTRITEDDGENRRPSNAPLPPPGDPPRNPAPPIPPDTPRNPPPLPNAPPSGTPPKPPPPSGTPPRPSGRPPRPQSPPDALRGFLRHLLNAAHMENTDTGDLLTLCLLYLLYREGADEELLVALGLLLIL